MENLNELFAVNNGNIFDFLGLIFTLCAVPFTIGLWFLNEKRQREAKERESRLDREEVST